MTAGLTLDYSQVLVAHVSTHDQSHCLTTSDELGSNPHHDGQVRVEEVQREFDLDVGSLGGVLAAKMGASSEKKQKNGNQEAY